MKKASLVAVASPWRLRIEIEVAAVGIIHGLGLHGGGSIGQDRGGTAGAGLLGKAGQGLHASLNLLVGAEQKQ